MRLLVIAFATFAGFASVLIWSCLRVGQRADEMADPAMREWMAMRDARREEVSRG